MLTLARAATTGPLHKSMRSSCLVLTDLQVRQQCSLAIFGMSKSMDVHVAAAIQDALCNTTFFRHISDSASLDTFKIMQFAC